MAGYKFGPFESADIVDYLPQNILQDTVLRLVADRDPIRTSKALMFRCPFCGDSKTDHKKRRGYVYTDNWMFKCFNCGQRKSFINFVHSLDANKAFDLRMMVFGKNREHMSGSMAPSLNAESLEQEVFTPDMFPKGSLIPALETNDGRNLIEGRKIRKAVGEKWFLCSCTTPGSPAAKFNNRIIIPYYRLGGKWQQFDARAVELQAKVRYRNADGIPRELYNIDFLDTSRPFFLTEGSIDSTFLRNSISFGGVEHFEHLVFGNEKIMAGIKNAIVVWDNDVAGQKGVGKWYKEGFDWFDWRNIRGKHGKPVKDINEGVMSGVIPLDSEGYVEQDYMLSRRLDSTKTEPDVWVKLSQMDLEMPKKENYVCLEDRFEATFKRMKELG